MAMPAVCGAGSGRQRIDVSDSGKGIDVAYTGVATTRRDVDFSAEERVTAFSGDTQAMASTRSVAGAAAGREGSTQDG